MASSEGSGCEDTTVEVRPAERGEEWLLTGGTLVTMDAKRRVLRGQVLVRDGRIVHVGRSAPAPRGVRRVLDVRGCAVLPGLVQAHVHLCQTLFRGLADELPLLAWLRERIWPMEAAHDERSLRLSADLGIAEMLRAGTTCILDMGTTHGHDVVFEALRDSGLRAASGKAMMDRGRGVPARLRERTGESLRQSDALAERWHGAAGGRLRYAYAPRFVLSCSERLLRGVAERVTAGPWLVHSHLAEQRAEREAVRAAFGGRDDLQVLADAGLVGPRSVLAHGVQLTARERRRVGRLGGRIAHCPSSNLKLASGIADVVGMREAGIVVGVGADGAPCNNRLDPWLEMRTAALLAKVRRGDAAALAPADVLAMATIDGARALGWDDEIGSLQVGKRADLVVVDIERPWQGPGGDVYSRLVYATTAAEVRHVFVDGRLLVRDGTVVGMDLEALRGRAAGALRRLLRRLR